MKLTYFQQLQHPNWQRRRLEMLNGAGWRCEICEDTESMFHVHHRRYVKGRMAWEYEDSELAVLCKNCHEIEHGEEENLKQLLACIPIGQSPVFNAISLLSGFFGDAEEVERLCKKMGINGKFASIGYIASLMRGLSTDQLCKVIDLIESFEGES